MNASNPSPFVSFAGWYGMCALLCAYILVSISFLSVHSIGYHLLNITGALGIAITSARKSDWPPVVLNSIWVIIGILAIVGLFW